LWAKGWKEIVPEVPKATLLPPRQRALPPGDGGSGGGGGGGGGRSGPRNRWAGRGAQAGEDAALAESRILRYGSKALKGLSIAGKVAFVVGAGITIASATYHLAQGDYAAASLDVADFFTFGGASFAVEKGAEASNDIGEGVKSSIEMRDFIQGGMVPPPQPWQETQQQRMLRQQDKQADHLAHPLGILGP
jgi:hypothetical protein